MKGFQNKTRLHVSRQTLTRVWARGQTCNEEENTAPGLKIMVSSRPEFPAGEMNVIFAAIDQAGRAPEWMLLFREGWGEIEGEGRYLVDHAGFDEIKGAFDRRGVDLVIDYEHQTLTGDKAPGAGWIKDLRYVEGRGIEAKTDWTNEAAGYIERGEYRYHSPVFGVRKSDRRVVWLHSVALTNSPKTNHLTPILAKLDGQFTNGGQTMDFLKKLIAKLGLAEGSGEDQVLSKIDGIVAKNSELETKLEKKPDKVEVVAKDVLDALGLKDGDTVSTVVASIHALKQNDKGMVSRNEFEKLQKQLRERDAQEIVAKAIAEGKITPDQADWAQEYAGRDIEGFKTFVSKAPVVVPVGRLPGGSPPEDSTVTDEAVLSIAKLFGNTAEEIKKHGGLN